MKVAVDLDGVLYEWQRTYRYMMREYRGVELPPVDEFWFTWNAPDEYTSKEDRKWMWSEGVRLGLFRYGHMIKGGRLNLQRIVDAGNKIQVVTHRPANAVQDTIAWVDLYFKDLPLDGLHIFTHQEPKSAVAADILIDDKIENIEDWVEAGREAILFDQPWNQEYVSKYVTRCFGWEDVANVVILNG